MDIKKREGFLKARHSLFLLRPVWNVDMMPGDTPSFAFYHESTKVRKLRPMFLPTYTQKGKGEGEK